MNHTVKRNGLRRHRGMTVVEVTIALVIITIISAAAVGMVLRSVSVEANYLAIADAQSSAADVLNCFRFSEDADTFLQALQALDNFAYNQEENAYVCRSKTITVTVKASFSPKKLDYTVAKPSGETIYSYTFPTEGGAS